MTNPKIVAPATQPASTPAQPVANTKQATTTQSNSVMAPYVTLSEPQNRFLPSNNQAVGNFFGISDDQAFNLQNKTGFLSRQLGSQSISNMDLDGGCYGRPMYQEGQGAEQFAREANSTAKYVWDSLRVDRPGYISNPYENSTFSNVGGNANNGAGGANRNGNGNQQAAGGSSDVTTQTQDLQKQSADLKSQLGDESTSKTGSGSDKKVKTTDGSRTFINDRNNKVKMYNTKEGRVSEEYNSVNKLIAKTIYKKDGTTENVNEGRYGRVEVKISDLNVELAKLKADHKKLNGAAAVKNTEEQVKVQAHIQRLRNMENSPALKALDAKLAAAQAEYDKLEANGDPRAADADRKVQNLQKQIAIMEHMEENGQKPANGTWVSDWISDKDKVSTDGKDDGNISDAEKWKSAGKGAIGIVKSMANNPWETLAIVGGAMVIDAVTMGAATPFLVAAGAAYGAAQVGTGVYNATTAKTDGEAKAAYEQIGGGTVAVATSALASTSALKIAEGAGVTEARGAEGLTKLQALKQCFKVSASKEMYQVSAKNTAQNLSNLNSKLTFQNFRTNRAAAKAAKVAKEAKVAEYRKNAIGATMQRLAKAKAAKLQKATASSTKAPFDVADQEIY